MTTILDNFVKSSLDPRIPGALSAGIARGFSMSDELKSREEILQLFQARNAYGHIRHICVDIAVQNEVERLGLNFQFEQKQVSRNGYTYPVIFGNNAVFTLHKTRWKKAMPKSAWNRTNRSFLNREISLFDPVESTDNDSSDNQSPYLMVTYGGLNYKLSYVNIGLPNVGATKWLGIIDISDSLSIVKPLGVRDRKKLNIAFNNRVEQMLEREKKTDGGKV